MCSDIRKYKLEDLSIAIVDDHEVVLEGMKSYMERNHIEHIETFKTAQSLLDRMSVNHFDIYIVDIELPDMEGAKLIENTVETHRQNMFSKLKAHNMADLIVKAISCGYINPKNIK